MVVSVGLEGWLARRVPPEPFIPVASTEPQYPIPPPARRQLHPRIPQPQRRRLLLPRATRWRWSTLIPLTPLVPRRSWVSLWAAPTPCYWCRWLSLPVVAPFFQQLTGPRP